VVGMRSGTGWRARSGLCHGCVVGLWSGGVVGSRSGRGGVIGRSIGRDRSGAKGGVVGRRSGGMEGRRSGGDWSYSNGGRFHHVVGMRCGGGCRARRGAGARSCANGGRFHHVVGMRSGTGWRARSCLWNGGVVGLRSGGVVGRMSGGGGVIGWRGGSDRSGAICGVVG
jgi:hypothetical protein